MWVIVANPDGTYYWLQVHRLLGLGFRVKVLRFKIGCDLKEASGHQMLNCRHLVLI